MDLTRLCPPRRELRTVALFVLSAVAVLFALQLLDLPVSAWATAGATDIRSELKEVTRWGKSDWILIPALVVFLLAWSGFRLAPVPFRAALGELSALAGFVFLGVGLPSLAATLLKRLIGRARPESVADAPGFQPLSWAAHSFQSFPSGHTTTAFAFATVVIVLWPRAVVPAVLFAVAIAASRVMLGAHYLTDVTAGALLGVLGACLVRNFFARRGWRFTAAAGRVSPRPIVAIPALFRS